MNILCGDIESVLVDEKALLSRIDELGAQISRDYLGKSPVAICVLKGASVFFCELCKRIELPLAMDFIAAQSYANGTKSSGTVRLLKDIEFDIRDRDVIIVEDIIDSGLTLSELSKILGERRPASLKIACLLDKPMARNIPVKADYLGFSIPDDYVVGFGLDFMGLYRNLPFIGKLKREVYS